MDRIKMAKLDVYTMKPQAAVFGLMMAMALVALGLVSNSYAALAFTCAWMIALVGTAVFQVQEKDSLDSLYGTLSLSVSDIVFGRHIFISGIFIVAILLSLVVQAGLFVLGGQTVEMIDLLFGISFSFFIFAVIVATQMPLFFRMGYLKARYLSLVPYFIMLALVFLPMFFDAFSGVAALVFDNQALFGMVFLGLGVLLLLASCRISIAAYKRQR